MTIAGMKNATDKEGIADTRSPAVAEIADCTAFDDAFINEPSTTILFTCLS